MLIVIAHLAAHTPWSNQRGAGIVAMGAKPGRVGSR